MSTYASAFSSPKAEEGRDITSHPLFPVLKLLLEKCDAATEKFGVTEVSLVSVDAEIEGLVRKCLNDCHASFPDPEVHNMVMLTLQVLRIHLLELERVDVLCQDFTTRYINCLKHKMQTELLPPDIFQEGNEDGASNTSGDSMFESYQRPFSPEGPSSSTPLFSSQGAIGFSNYCPMTDNPSHTPPYFRPTHAHNRRQSLSSTPNYDCLSDNSGNRKRGVLPKHATHVMRQWLFQHLMHPYPKESEKQIMASQTGLSLLQVNNWFINARRRVLQPIMDRSNPPIVAGNGGVANNVSGKGGRPKGKKSGALGDGPSSTSKKGAVNRFWPEKLRNASFVAPSVDSSAVSSSSSTGSVTERHQPVPPALIPPLSHSYGGVNENANLASLIKDERTWMITAATGEVADVAH